MTLNNVLAILVWTGAGAVLLFIIMCIDSLFTRYKDLAEIKRGNAAVAVRFVMKLLAQGYILSQSIAKSNDLWEALVVSFVSFIVLLVLEALVRLILSLTAGLCLSEGAREGKIAYALVEGSLHMVGALIIAACL